MSCPACGGSESRILWSVDADDVVRMALVEERDPERAASLRREVERLWGGPRCDLRRCDRCGFEYADPFVAGDAAFYALLYDDFHYGGHDWDWETTAARVDARLREGVSDARLLEVGAGGGDFLRRVTPRLLPPDRVTCTEFNPAALEGLRALGVTAIDRDFRELEPPAEAERFAFVCLFHVLEHLDDLDRAFAQLSQLTRDDGRLFISLPNPLNAAFYEERGVQLEWPPHHIGRFGRAAFEALGGRFGWRVVEHRIQPAPGPSLLRAYAASRFIQSSRRPGSWARRARLLESRPLRLAASAPFVGIEVLRALFQVPLSGSETLGRSHWVEMARG